MNTKKCYQILNTYEGYKMIKRTSASSSNEKLLRMERIAVIAFSLCNSPKSIYIWYWQWMIEYEQLPVISYSDEKELKPK